MARDSRTATLPWHVAKCRSGVARVQAHRNQHPGAPTSTAEYIDRERFHRRSRTGSRDAARVDGTKYIIVASRLQFESLASAQICNRTVLIPPIDFETKKRLRTILSSDSIASAV